MDAQEKLQWVALGFTLASRQLLNEMLSFEEAEKCGLFQGQPKRVLEAIRTQRNDAVGFALGMKIEDGQTVTQAAMERLKENALQARNESFASKVLAAKCLSSGKDFVEMIEKLKQEMLP